MSLNINGEKCVVCKAYLFDEDDVVYCPECGAPHHRECYNSLAHCGLQEFHGTESQYQRTNHQTEQTEPENINDMITCGMCGEKYDADEHTCPKCNTPNMAKSGGRFVTFDFSGGVPNDADLGDGVTAKEAKLYVKVNTHRYMPKFLKFKNGGKASWNWLAFLAPSAWLMSRKMYLLGSIVAALEIALMVSVFPFVKGINTLAVDNLSYQEMTQLILDNVAVIGTIPMILALIASYGNIAIRVLMGIFGDSLYRKKAISKIVEIKQTSDDVYDALQKQGGVNFILAVLTYFAVSELPQIIAYALGILR